MENEVTEVNALSLMTAEIPTEVSTDAAGDFSSETQRAGFIPTLSVCYGTSKIVEARKAQSGDFALGGQTNLGQSIEVAYLFYRFKASEWFTDTQVFGDTAYHVPYDERGIPSKPIRENKEYLALCNKYGPTGKSSRAKIDSGAELLVYIPDQKVFATLFCKSTLASGADALQQAGRGRLCSLTTKFVQGKKANSKWYEIVTVPLGRAVKGISIPGVTSDIDMPIDLLNKTVTMFLNPKSGVIENDTEATVRDR